MTPAFFLKAVVAPVTEAELALAGALFWIVAALGYGLLVLFAPTPAYLLGFVAFGLALVVVVPALIGYALRVLEAVAMQSRSLPQPEAGMLLPGGGQRRVLPLVPAGLVVATFITLAPRWPGAAWPAAFLVAFALLPWHVMLFAMTGSRARSLDPRAMVRLAVRLWPDWLWLLPAGAAVAATIAAVAALPGVLGIGLSVYWVLALAVLCGRLLARFDVFAETDIGPPVLPAAAEADARLERRRAQALDHAYGLVSRGNRDGGFRYLRQHAGGEADPLGAELRFMEAMWRWDLGEAPLFYAQLLIGRLLDAGADVPAMKVTLRALDANPRFRPLPGDLPRLREAASRLGNEAVLAALDRR